jgi:hypothetical protein
MLDKEKEKVRHLSAQKVFLKFGTFAAYERT